MSALDPDVVELQPLHLPLDALNDVLLLAAERRDGDDVAQESHQIRLRVLGQLVKLVRHAASLYLLRHDMGSRPAVDGFLEQARPGDDHPPATVLQEVYGRLDLRLHAARREVPLLDVALSFGDAHAIDAALLRFAEVEGHLVHRRRDDEDAGLEVLGQQAGGSVLVDDPQRFSA